MKFTAITISILLSIIASSKSKEAHGRRRHLNDVIKGEESDASMSMASVLYPARGGGSKSKSSPTPSPTTAPPAVCDIYVVYEEDTMTTLTSLTLISYNYSLVNVILSLTRVVSLLSKNILFVIAVKIRP